VSVLRAPASCSVLLLPLRSAAWSATFSWSPRPHALRPALTCGRRRLYSCVCVMLRVRNAVMRALWFTAFCACCRQIRFAARLHRFLSRVAQRRYRAPRAPMYWGRRLVLDRAPSSCPRSCGLRWFAVPRSSAESVSRYTGWSSYSRRTSLSSARLS